MADSSQLHALFLAGLAVAGCGGSTKPPEPPPGNTKTTTTTASATSSATPAPETPPDANSAAPAVAREFHSIGAYAKAYPNVEHLVAVETGGANQPFVCDPAPCTKEWSKLAKDAGGGNGAIVRRNGKLEFVLEGEFKEKLGAVDTPEKAAVLLHYYERNKLATCGQLKTLGVECAKGSDDAGVAVRKVHDGFEVATVDFVSVCPPPSSGGAEGIKFWRATTEGDRKWVESNALEQLSEEKVRKQLGPEFKCKPGFLGRMFEGFAYVSLSSARSELEYYVRAQHQEAAAVIAFERLAAELAAHDAPDELIDAARRAAREERRHAALFRREATRMSRELGVAVNFPKPTLPEAFAIRSLDEILRENIVEGCINETYSAVVATYQAEHAASPRMRAIFRAIAEDEQGHAALAYRIHAWGLAVSASAGALRDELRHANEGVRESASITALGRAMGEPDPGLAVVAFEHVSGALLAA